MTTIKATIQNGRIELEQPLDLPDGTELWIPIPEKPDDAMSEIEIKRILAAMDQMQPLELTEEELLTWETVRQKQRKLEKIQFVERVQKLERMWE